MVSRPPLQENFPSWARMDVENLHRDQVNRMSDGDGPRTLEVIDIPAGSCVTLKPTSKAYDKDLTVLIREVTVESPGLTCQ